MSVDKVYQVLIQLNTRELQQLSRENKLKVVKNASKDNLIVNLLYPGMNLSGFDKMSLRGGGLAEASIPWATLPEPALKEMLENLSRADIDSLRSTSKEFNNRFKKMARKGNMFFEDLIKAAPRTIDIRDYTSKFSSPYIFNIAWSPDGKYIASAQSAYVVDEEEYEEEAADVELSIKIWNVNTGQQHGNTLTLAYGFGYPYVAWNSNGDYLAGADEDNVDEADINDVEGIVIWNAQTLETVGQPLRGYIQGPYDLAWHPKNKSILASIHDNIRFWNVDRGEQIGSIGTGDRGVHITWPPDGTRLASGDGNGIRIWHTNTFEQIGTIIPNRTLALNWSPNGYFLASIDSAPGGNAIIKIWKPDSQTLIKFIRMPNRRNTIGCLAWHPDNRRLVSGDVWGNIIMWDTETGEEIETLHEPVFDYSEDYSGQRISVDDLAWSPQPISTTSNKRLLAAAMFGEIKLWAR